MLQNFPCPFPLIRHLGLPPCLGFLIWELGVAFLKCNTCLKYKCMQEEQEHAMMKPIALYTNLQRLAKREEAERGEAFISVECPWVLFSWQNVWPRAYRRGHTILPTHPLLCRICWRLCFQLPSTAATPPPQPGIVTFLSCAEI